MLKHYSQTFSGKIAERYYSISDCVHSVDILKTSGDCVRKM